ncbi:MAG: penicillin-binding protein 2 [Bacteroidales bacterium]|nr:penicillin-binding protein 2 [Bacteroidales bacterium]
MAIDRLAKRNLADRQYLIKIIIIGTGILFVIRLFILQVVDDSYMLSAENNVLRKITIYPNRGLIYDRNGDLLVYDEAAYDLMVIPRQARDIDVHELCGLLNISDSLYKVRMKKAKDYSSYKPSVFMEHISKEQYGYLEEKLYKFSGFFVQPRSLRHYPRPIAAHTLGYVGEVDAKGIAADPYYRSGDFIGKSGIEKSFEKLLRGRKGCRVVMVDVHNREQGSYREGKYDTLAEHGTALYLTLDAGLQEYGERLMAGKNGSIVAIDPQTGGILVFVSSPSYDPNLLVGTARNRHFALLRDDTLKPLMNRAVLGSYPPGSTFKMVNALVGLQENVISEYTSFSCYGPASYPIKCTHNHVSPLELQEAIQQSCNPYFWNVFRSIMENARYTSTEQAYAAWRRHVISFGFGSKFDTDIPFEVGGNIPEPAYFDKLYGRDRWRPMTIRSLAIGQGEILVTPLQLANLAVVIANRGFYHPPHLLQATVTPEGKSTRYSQPLYSTVAPTHFDVVREAMLDVFEGPHGTARWARLEGVHIGGKTGTAENPHGKDHSLFIAFAPMENPRIALSVIVENAGFGSAWAAPIASLLIEKLLNDTISRPAIEQRILEANLTGIP